MPPLPNLATCKKLGFIVPSSNPAVEPITTAIVQAACSNIVCLFTRIKVKTVGTDAKSTSQFSTETMVEAARLLADAEVDAILWNGTSGMWVGTDLETDRKFAQTMQDATNIPCSTTTIATVEALEKLDVKKLSLAVPYTASLTAKLVDFYTGCRYEVVSAERLEKTPGSNLEIAKSSMEDIEAVIRRSQKPETEAIIVACTNWPATGLVEKLEKQLGVVIVDSIGVTAWAALCMIDHKESVSGWGRLLADTL